MAVQAASSANDSVSSVLAKFSRLAAIASRGNTSQLPPKQVTVKTLVVRRSAAPSNSTRARYRPGGSDPNPTVAVSPVAASSSVRNGAGANCSRQPTSGVSGSSSAAASKMHARTVVAVVGTRATTLTLAASVNARLLTPSSSAVNAPSPKSGSGRQLGCMSPAPDPATEERSPEVAS